LKNSRPRICRAGTSRTRRRCSRRWAGTGPHCTPRKWLRRHWSRLGSCPRRSRSARARAWGLQRPRQCSSRRLSWSRSRWRRWSSWRTRLKPCTCRWGRSNSRTAPSRLGWGCRCPRRRLCTPPGQTRQRRCPRGKRSTWWCLSRPRRCPGCM
jgi:hypothetical protein